MILTLSSDRNRSKKIVNQLPSSVAKMLTTSIRSKYMTTPPLKFIKRFELILTFILYILDIQKEIQKQVYNKNIFLNSTKEKNICKINFKTNHQKYKNSF